MKLPAVFVGGIALVLALACPSLAADSPPRMIRIAVQTVQSTSFEDGWTETTSRSSQGQFVVVTEGSEGRIFIGERVSMVSYFYNYLVGEGYLTGVVTFQEVGTSLIARARVVGEDQIEVTLTPEISYLSPGGRGSVAVQRLSTSVVVPNGRSIEIGGQAARNDFESRFYRSASGQSVQFVLTPTVIG